MPPAALPYIGAGLAGLSAVQGASQQSKQNQINQEQLQQIAQQRHLGRLLGRTGASGNPFSPVYAGAFDHMDREAAAKPKPAWSPLSVRGQIP